MTNTHAPINDTLQYWMYLTITPGGTLRTRKHASAYTYFQAILDLTVPDLANSPKFPHRKLQRRLIQEKAEGEIKAEGKRQKAEGRRQKAEGRRQKGRRGDEDVRVKIQNPKSKIPEGMALRSQGSNQNFLGSPSSHQEPWDLTLQLPKKSAKSADNSRTIQLPAKSQKPKAKSQNLAEACLRCFISHQIDYACQQLASQFGTHHRFGKMDILPFILNDDRLLQSPQQSSTPNPKSKIQNPKSKYLSLATEILDTFNPDRSNLKTWTVRLVRHHPTVNSILLEHGVYLVSDWAILNDTTEPQLERILGEFYMLSSGEIRQFVFLLESFHSIYRGDRLHHHQTGRCCPPTADQLTRIGQYIQDLLEPGEGILDAPLTTEELRGERPKQILTQLQTLAHYLRDYRIHVRRGTLPSDSIDTFESPYWESRLIDDSNPLADQEDTSQRFLSDYRQAFEQSLDAAIQMVIEQKVARLSQRKGDRHRLFLKGLHLFHCQGQTMTEIAPHLGYERQDKVTYLLKLKDLRADIRHETLNQLRDRILSLAQDFADPAQLQQLDQQLDTLLEDPLTALITEADLETTGPRDGPLKSRFSRRLCRYLCNQYPYLGNQ